MNGNSSHQDSSLPGFVKTAIRNADMFWINENSKALFLPLRTQIVSLHSRLFFLISFSLSFFFDDDDDDNDFDRIKGVHS